MDLAGKPLEAIGNELIEGCNPKAGKNGGRLSAAFFPSNEDFRTGLAFWIGKDAMFLDNQARRKGIMNKIPRTPPNRAIRPISSMEGSATRPS